MKNMKIKTKLIVAFLVVALMAAISGIFGIFGLNTLNTNEEKLYRQGVVANTATSLWRNVLAQRSAYRGAALKYYMGLDYEAELSGFSELDTEFSETLTVLQGMVSLQENKIRLADTKTSYDEYKGYRDGFVIAVRAENTSEIADLFTKMVAPIEAMTANLQLVSESAVSVMATTNVTDGETANSLIILMLALVTLAVASSIFFAFYISRLISRPLIALTAFMKRAGTTGDITLSQVDVDIIGNYAQIKDETGQCISSTANFVEHLNALSKNLEMIADGDLTVDVEMLSEKDTMGVSLKKMTDGLNGMFSEIHSATTQVSTSSKQIADGAQSLAQGSTEQASAIEELSSSIFEIANKTKQNAGISKEAAGLSVTIRENAEKGSEQMDQMMQAVKEINEASSQIGKVIKVIDDIAFQTNILALNAAVEAARAGQHGKGFAVVAEEVRNLAAKSADAAKDTGGLIENSVEKANLGLNIATDTSASLKEIVEGINRSAEIVAQIARSSDEQAEAVAQINTGIDQVSQVVQQNSATAEESAATSEEMNGQSDLLEDLIAQFKLRDDGMRKSPRSLPATKSTSHNEVSIPEQTSRTSSALDNGSFGKY